MFFKIFTDIHKIIMELLTSHLNYIYKMGVVFESLASKPIGIVIFAPTVSILYYSTIQNSIILLAILLLVDFITGVWASKKRKEKYELEHPEEEKKRLISSDKMRLSIVKALTYIFIILGVFFLERIFFIKSFKWERVTDLELTGTLITIAICSGIELWSIVMENIKDLGFDLEAKVLKVARGGWKLFGAVKNGDRNYDDYQGYENYYPNKNKKVGEDDFDVPTHHPKE